jgi:hypothetical protein
MIKALTAFLPFLVAACAFDFDVEKRDGRDDEGEQDADGAGDADASPDPDAQDGREDVENPDLPDDQPVEPPPDGVEDGVEDRVEDTVEDDTSEEEPGPCTEGSVVCSGGGAQRCEGGRLVDLGSCPLGCDETEDACYVPSNVPPGLVDETAGNLDLTGMSGTVTMYADTGEISSGSGTFQRPAGTGRDAGTGITFTIIDQGPGAPGIGAFSVGTLVVPASVTIRGTGTNALAIIASGTVTLNGIIDVGAVDSGGGPGAGDGGAAGTAGTGPCPGRTGSGNFFCCEACSSGGGGGGFGGSGGEGGDGGESREFDGGAGGGTCGTIQLVPLTGGSGGAGGGIATGGPSNPGPGGGGGGALQLTSAELITIGGGGGVQAGGEGGGPSNIGGGGGGGSGGGVLVEAPTVTLLTNSILAANGGGGGAGDCT